MITINKKMALLCDNQEELEQCQRLLFEINYIWYSGLKIYLNPKNVYFPLLIIARPKIKRLSYISLEHFNKYKENKEFNYHKLKIYPFKQILRNIKLKTLTQNIY